MEKDDLKIVFMGTPDFALPSLRMLHDEGFHVAAVFTQPDRQSGRGHKTLPPPVKMLAQEYGIPVYQFEKVRRPEGVEALRGIAPDLLITAAYGQILTQEILDIPRFGCVNVHGSLLPRLRGAAPVQWALINGEKKTGVTTMMTALALDAGDMLEKDEIEITDDMTAGGLYAQLSVLGARTLGRTLDKLLAGKLVRVPQNEAEATYFPMFKKGFGEIDFSQPCRKIRDFVRGTNPAPGAYMMVGDDKVKVFRVSVEPGKTCGEPGEILFADGNSGLRIAAADGVVIVEELQWPGKSRTTAKELLRGRSIRTGEIIRRLT